tara:strand:+ start:407 stop:649 length:243 start_codon:yes stop_codon:yes gene_type:complete
LKSGNGQEQLEEFCKIQRKTTFFFDICDSWDDGDIILGYKVKNTHIVIVSKQALSSEIVYKMERCWVTNDNFTIVQVDID